MAEAIGLLSGLPVAVDDNALRVTASPATPLAVSNPPTIERVEVDLITTVGEYEGGDVIGGLLTFPLSQSGWSELFLYVYDAVGDNHPIDILVFSAAPAAIADNAPLTISAADVPKLMTVYTAITFTAFSTGGGVAGFAVVPVGAGLLLTPIPLAGDAVYVYLVMNSTASLTATDGLSAAIIAKG